MLLATFPHDRRKHEIRVRRVFLEVRTMFRRLNLGHKSILERKSGPISLKPYLWEKQGVGFFVHVIVNKGGLTPESIGKYVHSSLAKSYTRAKKKEPPYKKGNPFTHPDQTWFRLYGDDLDSYLKKAGKSLHRIEIDDTIVPCDDGAQKGRQVVLRNKLKQMGGDCGLG